MPVRGGPVGPDHVIEDTSQPVVVEDAWGTHLLVADDDYGGWDSGYGGGGGGGWQQQRLTDLLLRQARVKPEVGGGKGVGIAGVGGDGGEGGGWGGGEDGGVDGWGVDAVVDAEEAAGGWWREGDSEGDNERQEGQGHAGGTHSQPHDKGAGGDRAPLGDSSAAQQQQQQQHANGHVKQQPSAAVAAGPLAADAQQQQQQQQHAHQNANGTAIAAAAGEPAQNGTAAAAAAGGGESSGVDGAAAEAAAAWKEEGGGVEDEAGVPESVDASEQEAVMVSDSSGVSKGGYGWKPEALPRWSNTQHN